MLMYDTGCVPTAWLVDYKSHVFCCVGTLYKGGRWRQSSKCTGSSTRFHVRPYPMISHDMTSRVHCYAMLCFALGKQYLGVTSQTLSHKPSVIELVKITRGLYCSWRRGIILCLLILSRGGRRKEEKPYNAPTRKLTSIPASPLNCILPTIYQLHPNS